MNDPKFQPLFSWHAKTKQKVLVPALDPEFLKLSHYGFAHVCFKIALVEYL